MQIWKPLQQDVFESRQPKFTAKFIFHITFQPVFLRICFRTLNHCFVSCRLWVAGISQNLLQHFSSTVSSAVSLSLYFLSNLVFLHFFSFILGEGLFSLAISDQQKYQINQKHCWIMNLENSQVAKGSEWQEQSPSLTLKPLNKPANQWRLKDILITRKQKLMWACDCASVRQANTAYHLLNHYSFQLSIDSVRDEMAIWAQQDEDFLKPGLHNITTKYGKTYDQLIADALRNDTPVTDVIFFILSRMRRKTIGIICSMQEGWSTHYTNN